jgi:hypothetical protein
MKKAKKTRCLNGNEGQMEDTLRVALKSYLGNLL